MQNGEICSDPVETIEHKFFRKDNLPDNINEFDKAFIDIWKNSTTGVTIYKNKKER